jgi:hypothetical protein
MRAGSMRVQISTRDILGGEPDDRWERKLDQPVEHTQAASAITQQADIRSPRNI